MECPSCWHSNPDGTVRCEKCGKFFSRLDPGSPGVGKLAHMRVVAESLESWASACGVIAVIVVICSVVLAVATGVYWLIGSGFVLLLSLLITRAWLSWGAETLRCLDRIEEGLSRVQASEPGAKAQGGPVI